MKKRRILIIIAILVAVFLSFMIGTGFTKRTDVALGGYSVSEDGKTLTFQGELPLQWDTQEDLKITVVV